MAQRGKGAASKAQAKGSRPEASLEERGRENAREQEGIVTEIEAFQARRTAERPSGPAYWLITKNAFGRIEVLTLDCRQTLPVFSHEEEAEMFLRLGGMDDGWRVSESGIGELVSMLYGPCAGVEKVALDPLPEMVAERIVGLVSQARECFIERILARRLLGLWERRQRSGVGLISTPRPT